MRLATTLMGEMAPCLGLDNCAFYNFRTWVKPSCNDKPRLDEIGVCDVAYHDEEDDVGHDVPRRRTGPGLAGHRRLGEVGAPGLGEVGRLVNVPVGAIATEQPVMT